MPFVENEAVMFYVWGADRIVYGPVELPTLVSWVKDERVLADTWIFTEQTSSWVKASELAELKMFFRERPAGAAPAASATSRVTPESLRRLKILAEMDSRALESLLRYMQPIELGPFTTIVKPGEAADAMYFILEGELRAFVLLDGKETTLATMLPGESFGEVALVDKGQRSAFVASNRASLVLRLPSEKFDQILKEAPALAAPFGMGIARLLAGRLRALNKRYEDSIRFSRSAGIG